MNSVNVVDWCAILRAYHGRDCSVAEFCRRHHVSASSLYRHLKRDAETPGEPAKPRRLHAPKLLQTVRKTEPAGPRQAGNRANRGLLARLCAALDQKMTEFENGLKANDPRSPADAEREARTLLSLMRMFERLSEIGPEPKLKPERLQAGETKVNADADTIRRQLAERLEKLRSRSA